MALKRLPCCLLSLLLLAMSVHAEPMQVIVAAVEQREISDPIEALGTLRAAESAHLTSRVTETIAEIRFSDGQRVEQGEVLVVMTNREQQAELAAAEAEVAEARRQYRRVEELAERGQESAALLDQRRRDIDTAEARLRAVESRLSDRLIVAPFDGVLGLRTVSVGSLLTPGDRVATLHDDRQMKLDFSVPERFLAAVEPGMVLEARSRAWPEKVFEGQVSSLSNEVDSTTRSFQVRAVLSNEEKKLRPIVMTAITTVAGALPLIFSSGAGAETRQVIGVVVAFGVATSALLTLMVIPLLYRLLAANTGSPQAVRRDLEQQMERSPG